MEAALFFARSSANPEVTGVWTKNQPERSKKKKDAKRRKKQKEAGRRKKEEGRFVADDGLPSRVFVGLTFFE